MWKCPSCGTVNRGDTCSECGLERKSYSRYKPEMSGMRLFLAVAASILIIAVIFFAVNAAIDQRNRRRAKEYDNNAEEASQNAEINGL